MITGAPLWIKQSLSPKHMAKRIVKMMKKSEKNGDILMTGGGALAVGAEERTPLLSRLS